MRSIILAAMLGLAIVGCDSGTEAEVGPRLVLTVDTTAYSVGGIGELRLVNEDTMTVRYRSLYCAPVERSGPGGWEALGRVYETWDEELPSFTEGCGFLTRGFDNIGPGEEVTEIFELREFMGVEGTYRISTFETEGERFYVSQEFTVEAADEGS
ncbi:MAG: hypothetical protein EA351_05650 [Gemmatimonadales bacterium]|nr:MAG: hypothetical protein EA351_05650 [Gemmatimonadales bacterium]